MPFTKLLCQMDIARRTIEGFKEAIASSAK